MTLNNIFALTIGIHEKNILRIISLSTFAQEKEKDISFEEVQQIYDSLPRADGRIQWSENIKLDSSYTKEALLKNM